jgi:HAE1 family hydrophobic/amphiphilic exporter-1
VVNSDFDKAAPSLEVEIDRDRAAALGVEVLDIEAAMGYSFGGQMITQIYASNDQYQVILELLPELAAQCGRPEDAVSDSSSGTLVPLSSVMKARTSTIPSLSTTRARCRP